MHDIQQEIERTQQHLNYLHRLQAMQDINPDYYENVKTSEMPLLEVQQYFKSEVPQIPPKTQEGPLAFVLRSNTERFLAMKGIPAANTEVYSGDKLVVIFKSTCKWDILRWLSKFVRYTDRSKRIPVLLQYYNVAAWFFYPATLEYPYIAVLELQVWDSQLESLLGEVYSFTHPPLHELV